MTDKTELQKQIERETGLTIERMETLEQLNACLDAGLAKLYCDVFAEPPWEEKFSEEEASAYFREYFEGQGDIFVMRDTREKPVAFSVTIPLLAADEQVRLRVQTYREKEKLDDRDIAYFAEDGVDPQYRRRGLSTWMKKLRFEACDDKGVKAVLLRTSCRGYAEINVVNKTGGTVLSGIFQDVVSQKQDGTQRADRRAYYIFDKDSRAAAPDIVQDVKIFRCGIRDIAVITADVPVEARKDLSVRLRQIYPAIAEVVFSNDVVFEGKLYVAKEVRGSKPRPPSRIRRR